MISARRALGMQADVARKARQALSISAVFGFSIFFSDAALFLLLMQMKLYRCREPPAQ